MNDIHRTIRSLRSRERGITPDPAWMRSTRDRLLMQVRNSMPSAVAVEKNRKMFASARVGISRIIRGPAFVIASIIAVITGSSIASVRAADRALPGDALYTIKLVAEQTRIALTPSASDRMKLKAEFTKRRVMDMRAVLTSPVAEKSERVRQAADILKQDLRTLKEQLDEAKQGGPAAPETVAAAKIVDREAVDVVKTLKETALPEGTGVDVKKTVTEAQAQAADVGLNALSIIVDAHKGDAGDGDLAASVAEHQEVAAVTAAKALELATTIDAASGTARAPETLRVTATGTAGLAKTAQTALGDVQKLLETAKVGEAVEKLREASSLSFQAQSQIESILIASGADVTNTSASSSPSNTSSSSTPSNVSSGTSTTP